MMTVRPMTIADLTLYQQWLYTPHVAKWYHDPLSWIAEVEKKMLFSTGYIIILLSRMKGKSAFASITLVSIVRSLGAAIQNWGAHIA